MWIDLLIPMLKGNSLLEKFWLASVVDQDKVEELMVEYWKVKNQNFILKK